MNQLITKIAFTTVLVVSVIFLFLGKKDTRPCPDCGAFMKVTRQTEFYDSPTLKEYTCPRCGVLYMTTEPQMP